MTTEVEIRAFIDKNKYNELLAFFKKNGKYLGVDHQETYYLDSESDLRIQKNNSFSKIWLKKGNMHDEAREEIEVKFAREDFPKIEKIFRLLGFAVKIKWLRLRKTFEW